MSEPDDDATLFERPDDNGQAGAGDADPNEAPQGRDEAAGPDPDAPPLERIVEALLFAASEPLSTVRIAAILKVYPTADIKAAIGRLRESINGGDHAFELVEIAGGFRLLTRPDFVDYIRAMQKVAHAEKLSPAALETLAIIAYKQPVIKAEVDAIRGVKSDGTIQKLLRTHMIRVAGRADVIGRPLLYGTTKQFLDQFGLGGVDDLPKTEEVLQKMEQSEMPPPESEVTQLDMDDGPPDEEDALLAEALPDVPEFTREGDVEAEEDPDAGDAADTGADPETDTEADGDASASDRPETTQDAAVENDREPSLPDRA